MNRADDTPDLYHRFPTLTEILGDNDVQRAFYQLSRIGKDVNALFHQAEIDLRYLKRRLSVRTLGIAYKKQLLDETQFIQTVYEIYTAALLASVSEEIDLHAPGKGNKDCDFRIRIGGCEIYGDVKTRFDNFPFNLPPKQDASGNELYSGSRATVDYRVAERTPPDEIDRSTPESGELREIIIKQTLPKFPEGKPNLIVLGLIDGFGFPSTIREDLMAALYGDAFHLFRGGKHIPSRYPNGVFDDPTCSKEITSIAWVSLGRSRQGLIRRSGIFFNPKASNAFPEEVKSLLEQLLDRQHLLHRELEAIVEKLKSRYQPKKIILFGSLAQGDVKEGSDIDLAIIKETAKRPLDRCLEVASVTQPSVAVNFLVYTPEEFQNETKANNFFVVDEILKKGQVLYER
jgi:uncharacterized protein